MFLLLRLLDPGTETSFMHLMCRLAGQGRTIVLVTHATKNVMPAGRAAAAAGPGCLRQRSTLAP